ncbi:MAG: ABC transporter substrate-binding protein [Betaproteobacteria bacterium]
MNEYGALVEAFRQGLQDSGYFEGKNVTIEYRWGEGRFDRLPALATELVNRKVAVIATSGGMGAALAARSATSAVPIVFLGGGDPVELGLVASLNRPGGNVTGALLLGTSLDGKRLQMLRELMPAATTIAYLTTSRMPKSFLEDVQAVAAATGTKLQVGYASNEGEIDAAFGTIKQYRAHALIVAADGFLTSRRNLILALAARDGIPACYAWREFAAAGGLLSYGTNARDLSRQVGVYAARILKGAKPADLPIVQASKFDLVLNLKTAKKLGLTVTREFLARVDEVIE